MNKMSLTRYCLEVLQEKIDAYQQQLDELRAAAEGESKSTAGDKHETSRAMLNLEQEKLSGQMNELVKMKDGFHQLDFQKRSATILPGSLVTTDKGVFLVSVPLGKVYFQEKAIILLSVKSPLGAGFIGKSGGDTIQCNGQSYKIENID